MTMQLAIGYIVSALTILIPITLAQRSIYEQGLCSRKAAVDITSNLSARVRRRSDEYQMMALHLKMAQLDQAIQLKIQDTRMSSNKQVRQDQAHPAGAQLAAKSNPPSVQELGTTSKQEPGRATYKFPSTTQRHSQFKFLPTLPPGPVKAGGDRYWVKELRDRRYRQKLTATRKGTQHVKEYLVNWEGYGSDHDTWEPRRNIDRPLANIYDAVHPSTPKAPEKFGRPRKQIVQVGKLPASRKSTRERRPSARARLSQTP
ncbi:hypothetical protein MMC10_011200 [Thelotrema lepadinum]|nr:hypothetical protein [Thelotrema lepadinum]